MRRREHILTLAALPRFAVRRENGRDGRLFIGWLGGRPRVSAPTPEAALHKLVRAAMQRSLEEGGW